MMENRNLNKLGFRASDLPVLPVDFSRCSTLDTFSTTKGGGFRAQIETLLSLEPSLRTRVIVNNFKRLR